jgi:hypothetical protein
MVKGFMKDKKFHPIRNNKSPSKERKTREFEKTKIQSLIFPKNKYSITEAKEWASDHGYTAVKVEPTDNTWRIRQFSPNKIKFGGECRTIQFGGSGVQGVLCEVPMRFKRDMFPESVDEMTREEKKQTLEVLNMLDDSMKGGLDAEGKQLQSELRSSLR